jgi:hypothetical protein
MNTKSYVEPIFDLGTDFQLGTHIIITFKFRLIFSLIRFYKIGVYNYNSTIFAI